MENESMCLDWQKKYKDLINANESILPWMSLDYAGISIGNMMRLFIALASFLMQSMTLTIVFHEYSICFN